jgi:integrase
MEIHITTPKTKAGIRIIPMFDDVKRALLDERLKQMEHGFTRSEIDGYSGFIFQNRFQEVLIPHLVNRAIWRIIRDHNIEAEETGAVRLPHFSVHNLRHTFCTRLCENEPNIKIIQEIMGHRNIETTMDVYNEATKEKKMESFANLEGKIKIS